MLTDATYPVLNASSGQICDRAGSRTECTQRAAAGRFHQGLQLGRRSLEYRISRSGASISGSWCPTRPSIDRSDRWQASRFPRRARSLSADAWNAKVRDWLPTPEDRAFVQSLMGRVVEPGKFAELDRAAERRHQWSAGGMRIRPIQLKTHAV